MMQWCQGSQGSRCSAGRLVHGWHAGAPGGEGEVEQLK